MLKILGIIGDPIEHSLSPALHNAALRKLDLPYVYLPFKVPAARLGHFLKQARLGKLGKLAGLNVTIPHKEKVLRHLDHISPEAKTIGAVNTILFKGKKLFGTNTDAEGYRLSLQKEASFSPKGKMIFILGAGGAARAILYAMGQSKAKQVWIANRTATRATKLAKEFSKKFRKTSFKTIPFIMKELGAIFPHVDLLINSTSVGLQGSRFKNLPLNHLPKKSLVSDLVYRPMMTPLLKEAKRKGLKIHSGLGMLIKQGALSFEMWTGQKAPKSFDDLPDFR